MALTQGMSTLARDGAPRASLLAIVEAALQGWPRKQAPMRDPEQKSEDDHRITDNMPGKARLNTLMNVTRTRLSSGVCIMCGHPDV